MGVWALLSQVLGGSFDNDVIGVACSFWNLATAIHISGPGRAWDFCCRPLVCFPKVLAVLWFIVVLIYNPQQYKFCSFNKVDFDLGKISIEFYSLDLEANRTGDYLRAFLGNLVFVENSRMFDTLGIVASLMGHG